MKKLKILYSGESTGAASGFGTYGYNILSRLVNNPNFHIAEFASFGTMNDGKYSKAKWRYYPNGVDHNHPDFEIYNNSQSNKYGAWRFERVLLDFQPDIVFTIRDPWMMEHEHKSALRPFYHLAIMPTVDSAPQQHSWIEMFSSADSVFTYSDWAIPILQKQSGGKIQPKCSAYPGVELDIFYPKPRTEIRAKFGLPADAFIIGTVMRNQKRKLLEDLFMAFKIYLEKYGDTETGKKTFLLVHTSFPDFAGWDIQNLIKEYGIANKVYFTYLCQQSKNVIITKFSGTRANSQYTQQMTATMPNVGSGVTREQLSDIYSCMDLYCQYAICEGLGMPQVEAAACGIPIASVNYSAMSDIVNKTKGMPIKVERMFYEWETNAYRAYPDNNHAADTFYRYLNSDLSYRQGKEKQARNAANKHFTYDRTAQIWSDHFESIVFTGNQGKWNAPPLINNTNIPEYKDMQCSNTQYVEWLCNNVAKDPSLFFRYMSLEAIEQLNNGVSSTFKGGQPITRKDIYNMYKVIGRNKILCEEARANITSIPQVDFVEFAHEFEKGIK